MDPSTQLDAELKDFSGLAPLFPLPNVVLFPQALLPLHIFESRYRKMTADALDGERLIAMSLLRPGWDMLPSSKLPPIHGVTTLFCADWLAQNCWVNNRLVSLTVLGSSKFAEKSSAISHYSIARIGRKNSPACSENCSPKSSFKNCSFKRSRICHWGQSVTFCSAPCPCRLRCPSNFKRNWISTFAARSCWNF